MVAQTKQSLDNMAAVLKAGGSGMDKVVKTTILLADIKDFPKVNEVYATCQPATHTTPQSPRWLQPARARSASGG